MNNKELKSIRIWLVERLNYYQDKLDRKVEVINDEHDFGWKSNKRDINLINELIHDIDVHKDFNNYGDNLVKRVLCLHDKIAKQDN